MYKLNNFETKRKKYNKNVQLQTSIHIKMHSEEIVYFLTIYLAKGLIFFNAKELIHNFFIVRKPPSSFITLDIT